jgi:hypothetical protein
MADQVKDEPLVFAIPITYVNLILQECDEQISVFGSLVESCLDKSQKYIWCSDQYLIFYYESLFTNLKLKELFEKELNDLVFIRGKTGEELIVLRETLQMIEALLLARYHTASELKRLSLSTSLN